MAPNHSSNTKTDDIEIYYRPTNGSPDYQNVIGSYEMGERGEERGGRKETSSKPSIKNNKKMKGGDKRRNEGELKPNFFPSRLSTYSTFLIFRVKLLMVVDVHSRSC
ncbi:hypothetical protein CEXT_348401 [Caerostris extrusa]|uniref:Uncharacterized protein n=1 Tax=Caerostris extrusa TaxID=172846 RepID=A0AAV4Q8G8_CAEEX|nr:hypothetical protein CEXT_348401 [Caerostris extrusa]